VDSPLYHKSLLSPDEVKEASNARGMEIHMSNLNKTLYEIGEDIVALSNALDELGGDISDPEVAEAIDEWLLENRTNLAAKLDGYASLIRELEARADARKVEAKRLAELARYDENKANRLKERLRLFFEEQGMKKVETARFSLTLANNGGKIPVIVDDEIAPEYLPEGYRRVKYEPDNDAIRAALERGESLPFAHLGDRGSSIRIR
jgi:hypothetical protein